MGIYQWCVSWRFITAFLDSVIQCLYLTTTNKICQGGGCGRAFLGRVLYGLCMNMDDKLARLEGALRGVGRVAVALSGGVDSSVLMAVAHGVLGREGALGVSVRSETLSADECDAAAAMAQSFGWAHEVVSFDEFTVDEFAQNPPDRCYFCKRGIFGLIVAVAARRGFSTVVEGTNADDCADFRPGRRALVELGVKSPLLEAGLTKADVRELARRLGLPNAERAANSCPATRFPAGTRLTREDLVRVSGAERALAGLGLSGPLRVRVHGDVARLEVALDVLSAIAGDDALRDKVCSTVREAGYRYVCLDLAGYRMGSMNA